jgi:hypothetical protein
MNVPLKLDALVNKFVGQFCVVSIIVWIAVYKEAANNWTNIRFSRLGATL